VKPARDVRIVVVGLGTVGRWLVGALNEHTSRLESRYGFRPTIVAVATRREGFVAGERRFASVLDGITETEADVLVEVTASPAENGEPGLSHMREALRRGIPVVTSNKWPVALHGLELVELARAHGVPFRAESTVMSGTPLLRALVDGLAGTRPIALRGVVNATANFVLTRMDEGLSYDKALSEAQSRGLAERDPTADVEGYDAMAKAMILANLVFEHQLRAEDVVRRGIAGVNRAQIDAARAAGARIKEVVTIERSDSGGLTARVEPTLVPDTDPLAAVDGVANAVVCRAEPLGEIVVSGPGAGPELAGQGVFSDLIDVAVAHGRAR
jgi:homoserine dehydrogenase